MKSNNINLFFKNNKDDILIYYYIYLNLYLF